MWHILCISLTGLDGGAVYIISNIANISNIGGAVYIISNIANIWNQLWPWCDCGEARGMRSSLVLDILHR